MASSPTRRHSRIESSTEKTRSTATSPASSHSNHSHEPLELVVIGAGPHALSLCARLVDDEPDLITECERAWMMRRAKRMRPHSEVRKHLKLRLGKDGGKRWHDISKSTLVIDCHGRWMEQWRRDFEAYDIKWLRSHEHLHPDPFDF